MKNDLQFYSDKTLVEKTAKETPAGFVDLFPVTGSHPAGYYLLRGFGAGVGAVVQIPLPDTTSPMSDLSSCVATWLSTRTYPSRSSALTATVYLRVDDTGKRQILIGLVAGQDRFAEAQIAVSTRKTLGLGDADYQADLLASLREIDQAAKELSSLLRQEFDLPAKRLSTPADMLAVSRLFWTGAGTLKGSSETPYVDDYRIAPFRTFWVEDLIYFRQVYAMMSVSPEATKSLEARKDIGEIIYDAAAVTSYLPGIHIVAMCSGGDSYIRPQQASHGYGEGLAITKVNKKDSTLSGLIDSKMRDFLIGDIRGKQTDLPVPKTSGLKFSRLYIPSVKASEILRGDLGTFMEHKRLLSFERNTVKDLFFSSVGGDWQVIDADWIKTYYAAYPGALRLDLAVHQEAFNVMTFILEDRADANGEKNLETSATPAFNDD